MITILHCVIAGVVWAVGDAGLGEVESESPSCAPLGDVASRLLIIEAQRLIDKRKSAERLYIE